jgi:alkanesulfonate monooxygenase SsuD/methylene tetrahydromethanopterin reductase-like flavin-dependent oxidoreductase (luciferase family)
MWHQIGTYKVWHAQDDGATSDDLPPLDEAHLRERAIIGTPDSVVAQLRPWIEAFAGRDLHVILRLHYPGMSLADAEPALRLLGSDVIPALKRIHPA